MIKYRWPPMYIPNQTTPIHLDTNVLQMHMIEYRGIFSKKKKEKYGE